MDGETCFGIRLCAGLYVLVLLLRRRPAPPRLFMGPERRSYCFCKEASSSPRTRLGKEGDLGEEVETAERKTWREKQLYIGVDRR